MRRCISLMLALVMAVGGAAGCGEKPSGESARGKENVVQQAPANNAEREKYLRDNIAKISQENFPDNLRNTWKILNFTHKETQTYIEVEPEPKDVGYDKFIYVMNYSQNDRTPLCVGVYCLTKGEYSLLCAEPGWEAKLPKILK